MTRHLVYMLAALPFLCVPSNAQITKARSITPSVSTSGEMIRAGDNWTLGAEAREGGKTPVTYSGLLSVDAGSWNPGLPDGADTASRVVSGVWGLPAIFDVADDVGLLEEVAYEYVHIEYSTSPPVDDVGDIHVSDLGFFDPLGNPYSTAEFIDQLVLGGLFTVERATAMVDQLQSGVGGLSTADVNDVYATFGGVVEVEVTVEGSIVDHSRAARVMPGAGKAKGKVRGPLDGIGDVVDDIVEQWRKLVDDVIKKLKEIMPPTPRPVPLPNWPVEKR